MGWIVGREGGSWGKGSEFGEIFLVWGEGSG